MAFEHFVFSLFLVVLMFCGDINSVVWGGVYSRSAIGGGCVVMRARGGLFWLEALLRGRTIPKQFWFLSRRL